MAEWPRTAGAHEHSWGTHSITTTPHPRRPPLPIGPHPSRAYSLPLQPAPSPLEPSRALSPALLSLLVPSPLLCPLPCPLPSPDLVRGDAECCERRVWVLADPLCDRRVAAVLDEVLVVQRDLVVDLEVGLDEAGAGRFAAFHRAFPRARPQQSAPRPRPRALPQAAARRYTFCSCARHCCTYAAHARIPRTCGASGS